MNEALTQELECRQKKMKLEPLRVILQLRELLLHGVDIQKKCEEIFSAYRASMFVPLNLEIHAEKIGREAASLAVISAQYDMLAKQIQVETEKFMAAGSLVRDKVEECQFDVCNSLLLKEMFFFFKNETKTTPIRKEIEMGYLEKLGRHGFQKSKARLAQIDFEFLKFKTVYEEVKKLATALEIVSISGKIEASKVKQSSSELLSLLGELAKFKLALKVSLNEIDKIGGDLISRTHEMSAELA